MRLVLGPLVACGLFVSCSEELPRDERQGWGSGSVAGSAAVSTGASSATASPSDQTAVTANSSAQNSGTPGSDGMMATTLDLTGAPVYTRFIRLTNSQWARSVHDILALPEPSALKQQFQDAVAGTTDFTNNELVLDVDQRRVSDYRDAAESLAASATRSREALARIYPGTDATGFIQRVGRRAYRRPLTPDEAASYLTLFNQGMADADQADAFASGAAMVIRAMLQSPHFLYRTELGAAGTPLSSYEMAAKLSLWLRGTTPNEALLDRAASSDELSTAEGAAHVAMTMLQEPSAAEVMREFHSELYHLGRYLTLSKIGVPEYQPSLNAELLESSLRYFERLFAQDLGVAELLTGTTGFVGPGMAPLYGLPGQAADLTQVDLGPQRAGYFSQVPFLALYGINADPDSIHRGVSLNQDVLCALLGPPAEIPPLPPIKPGQTNRQRVAAITEGCGAICHKQQINPLGFAFEHFDGMGRHRELEGANLPIDSSGSFTFTEGTRSFSGAPELLAAMAEGRQTHQCYAKKLASFALQRDIVDTDLPALDALTQVSMRHGSIKSIIVELVRLDVFRLRAGAVQ